jgi:hypothetical protein
MARNFGVPRDTYSAYRVSMWPLLALTLIMIGLIDVAMHLHGPEAIASVVGRRFNGAWQPVPTPLHTGFLAGGKNEDHSAVDSSLHTLRRSDWCACHAKTVGMVGT